MFSMKSSEFHRKVKKNGWVHIRTDGSHYIYEKDGRTYPVPYHGAKEMGKGLEKKINKEMGLK
jgi:mRNA interferase HicA